MTKHAGAVNPHSVIFSKEFTSYKILRYSESSIATVYYVARPHG